MSHTIRIAWVNGYSRVEMCDVTFTPKTSEYIKEAITLKANYEFGGTYGTDWNWDEEGAAVTVFVDGPLPNDRYREASAEELATPQRAEKCNL